ncbi:ribonuclease P protein component [Candidatus Latescibacterota bacterium]
MRHGLDTPKVKVILRQGMVFRTRMLSVRYLPKSDYRYAPVISKKQGNAVRRNRVKRIIRDIMFINRDRYPSGYYMVYYRGHSDEFNRHQLENTLSEIMSGILS